MVKFVMLCGISGSGKSTYAISYQVAYSAIYDEEFKVISSDTIRGDYFGDENDQTHNNEVFDIARKLIRKFLLNNENVILDATNIKIKDRKSILDYISDIPNVYKECKVFIRPVEECIENQKSRYRQVKESVIRRQDKQFQKPTKEEGFDEIMTFYCDKDGVAIET